jgi:hypothetical protein
MPPLPPPPKKSGPNVGLIVGLGCLGIFVISAIVAGVAVFALRRNPTYTAMSPSRPVSGGGIAGSPTTTGSLDAELRDLRAFKSDLGKMRHFVGELHNTGDVPLGFPSAKVTLYDASNTALESAACASPVRVLPPGKKVPCSFTTRKTDAYTSYKVEITPVKANYKGDLPDFAISDLKFTPKKGSSPHQLDGKITNKSSFTAKQVWALVSLYGVDTKIVGAEQALVSGTDLEPGASGLFSAKLHNVAAAPEKYSVIAVGYSD